MSDPAARWRRATPADWPFVAARLADPANLEILGPIPETAPADAGPDRPTELLIWEQGAPRAFAWLTHADEPAIKIEEFAVHPPGQGLGATALPALLDWVAGNRGHPRIFLHCRTDNAAAIRLYRRTGFGDDEALPARWVNRAGHAVEIFRLWRDL